MKKFLALTLLISAISIQAMEKSKTQKNTVEQNVQKAAEQIAQENKKQETEVGAAFITLWESIKAKGQSLKQDLLSDDGITAQCDFKEYAHQMQEKGNDALNYLSSLLNSPAKTEEIAVIIVQQVPQPTVEEQPKEVAKEVVAETPKVEAPKIESLDLSGLTKEQIEFMKTLVKEAKERQIR